MPAPPGTRKGSCPALSLTYLKHFCSMGWRHLGRGLQSGGLRSRPPQLTRRGQLKPQCGHPRAPATCPRWRRAGHSQMPPTQHPPSWRWLPQVAAHLLPGVSSLEARGERAPARPTPVTALEPCQGQEARLLGTRARWGRIRGSAHAVQQGGGGGGLCKLAWGRPRFCPRKPLAESLRHTKAELKSGPVQGEAELAAWSSKGVSGAGTEGL